MANRRDKRHWHGKPPGGAYPGRCGTLGRSRAHSALLHYLHLRCPIVDHGPMTDGKAARHGIGYRQPGEKADTGGRPSPNSTDPPSSMVLSVALAVRLPVADKKRG